MRDDGAGTMEVHKPSVLVDISLGLWQALSFSSSPGGGIFFPTHKGTGKGPWVMADLENGLFGGNETVNMNNTPIEAEYVTAMINGRQGGTYVLKGGDSQSGSLKTLFDGPRSHGYSPMQKQGAIILGIGGEPHLYPHTSLISHEFLARALSPSSHSPTAISLVVSDLLRTHPLSLGLG